MNVLYSNFDQFFPSTQESQVNPPKKMDIRNLLAPVIKEYKSFETDSKRVAPYPTRSRSTFTTLSSLRNSTGSMRSSTTLSDDHSSVSSSHDHFGLKLSREIMDIAEVLEGMKKATVVDSTPSISTSYEALPDTKYASDVSSNSTPSDGISKSDSLRFCNRSFELKPKKRRRRREEIERKFLCPIKLCDKSYGSEGALKTHIKIKHKNLLKNHQDAKSLIDSLNAVNQESQSPQSPPGSSSGDDNATSDEEDFQIQNRFALNASGMDTS